jgi:hypothetical protein
MKALNVTLGGLTALLMASSAMAAGNTTAASARQVQPSILDKLTVNYTNVFYGPSLETPLKNDQPDVMLPTSGTPLDMKNYISVGYKLTDTVRIAPVFYFRLNPTSPHEFRLQDPYLRLSNSKIFSSKRVSISADIRYGAPVSERSRQDWKSLGYFLSKQVTDISIPDSRFSFTLITSAQVFLQPRATGLMSGTPTILSEAYAGPMVNYQILPNLQAFLLYEMVARSNRVDGLLSQSSAGTDLEPGLSWDITPKLNFSPFLDIKTGGRIAADTTSIGAIVSWTLL